MQIKMVDGCVLVAGTATRDAEYKLVGVKNSPMCTFSLAVGKNKDTTTIFANCKAWRKLADYASGILKGDTVCVLGSVEEREYNGKTYKTLVAEWLNYPNVDTQVIECGAPPNVAGNFAEIESSEDELPF